MDRITRAKIATGPYRVVPGDTLQVDVLSVLDAQSWNEVTATNRQEFKYRVDDRGAILLPIVGPYLVAGKTLSEIEAGIVTAYYPKYVKSPFPVHAAVLEYETRRVSIVGAVAMPGVYSLRHDEMSLVSLLMRAGGITEKGAAVIQITRMGKPGRRVDLGGRVGATAANTADLRGGSGVRRLALAGMDKPEASEDATPLVLPVKGLNIPFVDVALEEGDHVVVEWPQEQFVAVVGLVTRPGNLPYPPTARYTLIQAISFAGGLDLLADPRYVSVYRLRSDGSIARITVQLVNPKDHEHLTNELALPLMPGDVVSVEHTPRTRLNAFLDRIFRVSLGLYLNPNDLWGDE